MITHKCPTCGLPVHSSDTSDNTWICPYPECGGEIPKEECSK